MKTKLLEVGHDLTISPWQMQDGLARRHLFCRNCLQHAEVELDLTEEVGNKPVQLTLQYVQQFEQRPCRANH